MHRCRNSATPSSTQTQKSPTFAAQSRLKDSPARRVLGGTGVAQKSPAILDFLPQKESRVEEEEEEGEARLRV